MKRNENLAELGMKLCPYNENHKISVSKFQQHLVKCENSLNITDRNRWKTCPFNFEHKIKVEEYDSHLIRCADNVQSLRSCYQVFVKPEKLEEEVIVKTETFEQPVWCDFEQDFRPNPNTNIQLEDNSKPPDDDWPECNPNSDEIKGSEYLIKKLKTAEEVFDLKNPYTDPTALTHLTKSERKKLNEMKVKIIKEKIKEAKPAKPMGYCHKIQIRDQFNALINITKSMKGFLIRREFWEIQNPITPSIVSENVSEDEYDSDVESVISVDMVLRRPKANPFTDYKLRKPKINN